MRSSGGDVGDAGRDEHVLACAGEGAAVGGAEVVVVAVGGGEALDAGARGRVAERRRAHARRGARAGIRGCTGVAAPVVRTRVDSGIARAAVTSVPDLEVIDERARGQQEREGSKEGRLHRAPHRARALAVDRGERACCPMLSSRACMVQDAMRARRSASARARHMAMSSRSAGSRSPRARASRSVV